MAGLFPTAVNDEQEFISSSAENAANAKESEVNAKQHADVAKDAAGRAEQASSSAQIQVQLAKEQADRSTVAADRSVAAQKEAQSARDQARSDAQETRDHTIEVRQKHADVVQKHTEVTALHGDTRRLRDAAEVAKNQSGDYAVQSRKWQDKAKEWAISDQLITGEDSKHSSKWWAERAGEVVTAGGVAAFNGRVNMVMPMEGDYTAEMTGSYPKTGGKLDGPMITDDVIEAKEATIGGKNGMMLFTNTSAASSPIRPFKLWNFKAGDIENGMQFTDGSTWLGDIGTRVALRPNNQTKTEFRLNGCMTTLGNSEAYRINYGNYGTFWRQDGQSLYLMQTNKGDVNGPYNNRRPLRVNLESGDVSINKLDVEHARPFMGLGTAVTTNVDLIGVKGLGSFIAIGDSDTGVGQRSDGNLWLMANNIGVLRVTPQMTETTRRASFVIRDSQDRIVMPSVNSSVVQIDTSKDGNNAGANGLTLLGYNNGDKYHHYFRGAGNFNVNMPYAHFDKDLWVGNVLSARQLNLSGSLNTTSVPQGVYKWDDLNNAPANGANSFLRRFRSQGNSTIFHEVVRNDVVEISNGATAGANPIYGYTTNQIIHHAKTTFHGHTVSTSQDAYRIAHGQFGTFWRNDGNSLYLMQTKAGDANGTWTNDRPLRLDLNNKDLVLHNNAQFRPNGDVHFGGSVFSFGTGTGDQKAWLASDGNIWGTQWGRYTGKPGKAEWLGSALNTVNNAKLNKAGDTMTGTLYSNHNSSFISHGKHTEGWGAVSAEQGAFVHSPGVRSKGAYYPAFRHVSSNSGGGYRQSIDLGMVDTQNGWGEAVLRLRGDNPTGQQQRWHFKMDGSTNFPGAIGIGATNAWLGHSIALGDSDSGLRSFGDGNLEAWTNNQRIMRWTTGEIVAEKNINAPDVYIRSDARLKTNINKIDSALDKVCKLRGVTYDKAEYIGGEVTRHEAGVIAQELQAVLPEAVAESKDAKGNEILTVSSSAQIALLIEAIKELKAQNDELRSLIK